MLSSFIILAFATYEISWLLHATDKGGPYDILHRIRRLAGVRYDEFNKPIGANVVSSALLCMYCNSFWIAVAMAILFYLFRETFVLIALPLAIHGAVILALEGEN